MDILNKTNIQNKILRAPDFGDEGGGGASSSSSNVINIGGVEVDKFYLGNSDDVKIYLGDTLLYPQSPTPPTPTLKWVSYSEGDAIPSEGVYKTYGFRIPTQTLLDIVENGKYLEISLSSEEKGEVLHPVSVIDFDLYSEGFFLTINGNSQEISYDPSSDEYLEIIFSDYGADYNYNVGYVMYGEEGEASQVYDFPIDMDLYDKTLWYITIQI